jgi:DNA-binding CsgD family transcriptional regulator
MKSMAPKLSPREREMLGALSLGQTQKQFARSAGISPSTAKDYALMARIKLGAKTNAHAVSEAVRMGLI